MNDISRYMMAPYKARCGCTIGEHWTMECALPDKASASEVKSELSESETVICVADFLEESS